LSKPTRKTVIRSLARAACDRKTYDFGHQRAFSRKNNNSFTAGKRDRAFIAPQIITATAKSQAAG
jgi:hypothetical protein